MRTRENIPDQTGKTVIVTGANVGLGFETALALYEAGAHVVLACRNQRKAAEARTAILAQPGSGTLETGVLDLVDLRSVEHFATSFRQRHAQLLILVNNAGVATPPAAKTAEGYELQFSVNFLGHFAPTGRLYPVLQATSGARIVTLSSMGYQCAAIDFDNLKPEKGYVPLREYRPGAAAAAGSTA
ncbi:SDR family NAD(P)-dependent oxidoreductase [uncultured Hymenobacter sp.]|uniref:SDR family NAD(P)-dependent oxidoreductase n=1 Tax=uncultured Hymenobacter sp. TaxID=170016 RepID=UPI0035CBCEEF